MSEAAESPRTLANRELDIARHALSRADFPHAALHVAQALAADPALPDTYELVEYLSVIADDPDALFPLVRTGAASTYIGDLAVRAHLRARSGDPDAALADLVVAAAKEPTKPWAGGGAMGLPDMRARLDPQRTGRSLSKLASRVPQPLTQEARAGLEPFLDLARDVTGAHPGDIELAVHASGFARALGNDAAASAWCERAQAHTPGPLGFVMLGFALRDAQRYTEMETAWVRAIYADPDNLDVYVDLASTLVEHSRRVDGERWLVRALTRDPRHARARALRYALEFAETGDAGHLVTLVDEACGSDRGDAMLSALNRACDGKTWLNRVPMPGEAVTALCDWIAHERSQDKPVQPTRTTEWAIEPASAVAALLAMAPGVRVQVISCPQPDLRIPLAQGSYRVWKYDGGTTAVPAVAAPSTTAADLLREVANLPWPHPVAGYRQAERFADTSLDDLLGLLCHMPAAPANDRWEHLAKKSPTYWPRLAQPWICLGILHHRPHEPWPGSTRRRVLVDLINGVEDWTTDAALFALVVAAWMDPEIRADVLGIVRGRLGAARTTAVRRSMTIAPSIAQLMLLTPGATPADCKRARRLIGFAHKPARSRIAYGWRRIQIGLGQ